MDVLMQDSVELANRNDRRTSTKQICESCLCGHRASCERPIECPCLCRSIQIVTRDEAAILNARWEAKLAKHVAEMLKDAIDREVLRGVEKAMAAAA